MRAAVRRTWNGKAGLWRRRCERCRRRCAFEETGTNPFVEDTDGDGLTDGQEIFEFVFDPIANPFLFNPGWPTCLSSPSCSPTEEVEFGSDPLDPDDPPFPLDAVVVFGFDAYDPASGFVPDDSGNGNHGRLISSGPNAFNVTDAPDRFGQVDRAARFERDASTAGIIDLGERPEFDGPLTIALWVRGGSGGFLFGTRGRIGDPATLELEKAPGGVALTIRDRDNLADEASFVDPVSLPNDEWVHVAFVIEHEESGGTSSVTYYRDGEAAATVGGSFGWRFDNDPPTTEMSIGARFSCSTNSASPCYCNGIIDADACTTLQNSGGFDGLMDEVRLYARPLNAAEVADLYHEGGWPLP